MYIGNVLESSIGSVTMQFFAQGILVALFGDISLSDRIGVAQSLNKATKNLFSGEQTILPIPDDAPPEIPRVILGSKDKIFSCHVSPRRLEFSLEQKKGENKRLKEVQDEFLSQLANIAHVVKKELGVKVERIGIVVNSAMFPEEPSVDFLTKKFLRSGTIMDPRELNLNFLHKFTLGGFKVNRWHRFRCLSPEGKETLEAANALLITTDVNTILEIKYDFSVEQISVFCPQVFTFMESDLESFFAKED